MDFLKIIRIIRGNKLKDALGYKSISNLYSYPKNHNGLGDPAWYLICNELYKKEIGSDIPTGYFNFRTTKKD
jgi:hypothetical protein